MAGLTVTGTTEPADAVATLATAVLVLDVRNVTFYAAPVGSNKVYARVRVVTTGAFVDTWYTLTWV